MESFNLHHESIPTPKTSEVPTEFPTLEDTNLMQMMLMDDAGGEPLKWIKENAVSFRELIESQGAEILKLWKDNPQRCTEYLKVALRESKPPQDTVH